MSDLSDIHHLARSGATLQALGKALQLGLEPLRAVPAVRLADWAHEHFVLVGDSSHATGRWELWPFQVGLLDWMGDDAIEEVDVRKSKRVGYTKSLAALIAYNAAHRHRNQALWQPTDDDRDSFVATEIDPVIAGVPAVRQALRATKSGGVRDRVSFKRFRSSVAHFLGGKAARAYRRITVACVMLDEIDGFDLEIEKSADPVTLAQGRLEGAAFPQLRLGTTPREKGSSHIEHRESLAHVAMRYMVDCPHCGVEHPLTWGGPKAMHGFKWDAGDTEGTSVRHMCPHCHGTITQADYLQLTGTLQPMAERNPATAGAWVCIKTGVRYGADRTWRNAQGQPIPAPRHVSAHVWAAYSPQRTWASIVAQFLAAWKKKQAGDHGPMKGFTNETLGETSQDDFEQSDWKQLKARAEAFPLRRVPRRGLVLVAGVDVQDNRFHANVWAFGRDDEAWIVDDRVLYCDPGAWASWVDLDTYLSTRFPHEGGQTCAIDAAAIDAMGHFTHHVYRYVMHRESRRIHATRGRAELGRPIVMGCRRQDVNVDGKIVKDGVGLWDVCVNTAKDLLHHRLQVAVPGPGYMHLSTALPDEFFSELVAEVRVQQKVAGGHVTRWVKPNQATRNERLDTAVLALFCAARMKLPQYTDAEWRRLELALCPPTVDLFAPPVPEPLPEPELAEASAAPAGGALPAQPAVWAHQRRRRVLSKGV